MHDKSSWGDGPWQHEPDELHWRDEATALPCMIVRSPVAGVLCGYVGVPPGHAMFGLPGTGLEAHGGITFSGLAPRRQPYYNDGYWFFGFDTAHALDFAPALEAMTRELVNRLNLPKPPRIHERYRTLEYVKGECARLAGQLCPVQNGEKEERT